MSKKLILHAVGSMARSITVPSTSYHFFIDVKVTDAKGLPVKNLKAENFTLCLSGLESSKLGGLIVTPSTDDKLFPGFYKLLLKATHHAGLGSFDLYVMSGYLFNLRIDYLGKHGTTPVCMSLISSSGSE